jgi:hypothetical protein
MTKKARIESYKRDRERWQNMADRRLESGTGDAEWPLSQVDYCNQKLRELGAKE